MTIDLVIYDLDGVLVDSEGLLARVWSRLLGEHGVSIAPDQLIRRFVGGTGQTMAAVIVAETGNSLADETLSVIRTQARAALARELAAVDGAADLVMRLSGARCICSNSAAERIDHSLERTGLSHLFSADQRISADHVDQPKPGPDMHLLAMERFAARPDRAVVIEDSVTGVTAAVAAGCRVIGFTGASHILPGTDIALRDAGADHVTDRLDAIPDLLARLR